MYVVLILPFKVPADLLAFEKCRLDRVVRDSPLVAFWKVQQLRRDAPPTDRLLWPEREQIQRLGHPLALLSGAGGHQLERGSVLIHGDRLRLTIDGFPGDNGVAGTEIKGDLGLRHLGRQYFLPLRQQVPYGLIVRRPQLERVDLLRQVEHAVENLSLVGLQNPILPRTSAVAAHFGSPCTRRAQASQSIDDSLCRPARVVFRLIVETRPKKQSHVILTREVRISNTFHLPSKRPPSASQPNVTVARTVAVPCDTAAGPVDTDGLLPVDGQDFGRAVRRPLDHLPQEDLCPPEDPSPDLNLGAVEAEPGKALTRIGIPLDGEPLSIGRHLEIAGLCICRVIRPNDVLGF